MAYIGFSPSQLAVAPFAVKSFTGDGSTTTFTLDQSVPGANEANVEVFVENGVTVTTNYTLSTNKNAESVGPITINSSIAVTVPSGQRWLIL
jgi:hypothetical protein